MGITHQYIIALEHTITKIIHNYVYIHTACSLYTRMTQNQGNTHTQAHTYVCIDTYTNNTYNSCSRSLFIWFLHADPEPVALEPFVHYFKWIFSYFYLLFMLIVTILRRDAISMQKQHLAALHDTKYR